MPVKIEKENSMKTITLLAAFVAIVFTFVGPATVLAADPTGSEPKSPEAIASTYVVDLVATAAFGAAMNDNAPVVGSMVNNAESAPPLIEYVSVPLSGSVA